MVSSNDFRSGKHVVYRLHAHLVFTPKYRRKVITGRVEHLLCASFAEVCAKFEATLIECNDDGDHIHLLVDYPPKVALSALVNSLKGVSSRRVRQQNWPEVKRALRGDHFWSPSYCVVSCGGAPIAIVREYIEHQKLTPRKPGRPRKPRPLAETPIHPLPEGRGFPA